MKIRLFAAVSAASLLAACATPADPAGPAGPVDADFDRSRSDAALLLMGVDPSLATVRGSEYRFAFADFAGADADEMGPDAALVIGQPDVSEARGYRFSQLAIENLSGREDGEDIRLGRMAIVGPNEALSDVIIRAAMADEPDWQGFAENWTGYRFDEIALENAVVGMSGGGDGGKAGSGDVMSLDRMALTGFGDDRTGAFEILGLSLDIAEGEMPLIMSLGEARMDGIALDWFDPMVRALANGETDEVALLAAYAEGMSNIPVVMEGEVVLRDFLIDSAPLTMSLDYMVAETVREGDRLTSTSDMGAFIFRPNADHPEGAEIAAGLGMMGYSEISMTAGGVSLYDESEDRMWTTEPAYFEVTDALRVSFDMDMSGMQAYQAAAMSAGLSPAAMDPDASPEASLAMMREMYAPLIINELSITITDLSLLERGLALAAQEQGSTPEQLRAQAGMMVAMGVMAAPTELPRDILMDGSEALTQFITEGGSITVTLAPDTAYPLARLFDEIEAGEVDFDALGISFSAEAP